MLQTKIRTRCHGAGAAGSRQPTPVLVDKSFEEPRMSDVVLCSFVSAKPFLGGAIIRVYANGVRRAFRVGRDLTQHMQASAVVEGDYLRLGVNRVADGTEFVESIDRLVIASDFDHPAGNKWIFCDLSRLERAPELSGHYRRSLQSRRK